MENLIMLLTASLVLYKSNKKFRPLSIGDTGCSVHFSPEASFDYTQTDDGDSLYYAEHREKLSAYGVLCARLQEPLPLDEAKDVMTNYLQRLQRPFYARHQAGLEIGEVQDGLLTMEDYWQDDEQMDWKVKGYTDGHTMAVLYVKNINDGEVGRHDQFLDSFSFPNA